MKPEAPIAYVQNIDIKSNIRNKMALIRIQSCHW